MADTITIPYEEQQSLWSAMKESIRGSHRDYTRGPIGRAILLLAIPMVLEMIMESVFAVVDIFWVSHLGTDAAATVGLTESLLTLIYALAIGLSIGAMAMIARRIGEQNPDGAARAAVQAIALALIVSFVLRGRCAARAKAAHVDGWLAIGCRARRGIHARDARRQCHSRDALHDQRDLSRRR